MQITIEITDKDAEEIVELATDLVKMAGIRAVLAGKAYEIKDKYIMKLADAVVKARKGNK